MEKEIEREETKEKDEDKRLDRRKIIEKDEGEEKNIAEREKERYFMRKIETKELLSSDQGYLEQKGWISRRSILVNRACNLEKVLSDKIKQGCKDKRNKYISIQEGLKEITQHEKQESATSVPLKSEAAFSSPRVVC